ncbi:MAG: peptidase MA family metallohydrolase [Candidatus Poribacteria bacterium]|nr:peptidase MA family metallohydrolase [Candidatus Poribacteria bacterium]
MLESMHFQIYYQPGEPLTQEIAAIAGDFYPRLDRLIQGVEMGKIEIWICETQEQFQAAVHAPIQDWAIGCAFPLSRRIMIQNPRVIVDRQFQLAQVLRHEIVHVAFGQRTKATIGDIPLWFVEGIAIYLSGEWTPHRHKVLFKHILSNSIIPLAELTERFPPPEERAQLAYAESLNAVAWLVEIAGVEKLWEIIDLLGEGSDLKAAYERAIGWNLTAFDAEWRASLSQRYHWAAIFSSSYLFWGGLALLFVLVYLRCWQRARRKLAALEQEESQVDAFFRTEG